MKTNITFENLKKTVQDKPEEDNDTNLDNVS
jgi:hypothetical protein